MIDGLGADLFWDGPFCNLGLLSLWSFLATGYGVAACSCLVGVRAGASGAP